jgi:hypothetical protein
MQCSTALVSLSINANYLSSLALWGIGQLPVLNIGQQISHYELAHNANIAYCRILFDRRHRDMYVYSGR